MGQSRASEKVSALQSLVREYQAKGLFTHCFVECGRFAESSPRLQFSILPDGRDIFDLSSLTKALVTTPLMFSVIGNDLLRTQSIGEFAKLKHLDPASPLQGLKLSSLLGHRSGLPGWRNFWLVPQESGAWTFPQTPLTETIADAHIMQVLMRSGLPLGPANFVYSDLGFLLLGVALRSVLRVGLQKAIKPLFSDLSSDDFLDFTPTDVLQRSRAIPTSYCQLRGRELQGEVHDENCSALGGVTGHAGLFGNGVGAATFLRKFVQSDLGREVVSQNARLRNDQAGDDGLMGWRQGKGVTASCFGRGQAIGHYGFTGTGLWIVPNEEQEADTYCIVLTNRVKSGRINPLINDFRKSVHQVCWEMVNL